MALMPTISRLLFKISPGLRAVVSDVYCWTNRFNPVVAYLRRRYIKDAQAFWANEGGIEPLEDSTERTELLRHHIGSLAVKSVLEVGCSYGAVLKAIMQDEKCAITRLAGCDFSTARLEKVKDFTSSDRVELAYADVTKELPYEDNAFDLSFTISTLQVISPESLNKALSEMVRVTRRYVIHEEYMVPTSLSFVHNYELWYQEYGHQIVSKAKNWKPLKRHRLLLMVKLNKSNSE